jgi:NADH:ubiquinone oxidoreductase subunit H
MLFISLALTRLVPILLCVAFLTLAERAVLAGMQRRVGPWVSGTAGILQPFWDGLKLGLCEPILPTGSSRLFLWAPVLSFILSQWLWVVVPFGLGYSIFDLCATGVAVAGISSLAVYAVLFAGWASNSKYAFLGGCRSAAGMISYELPMGVILVSFGALLRDYSGMHSLSISTFHLGNSSLAMFVSLLPLAIIWFSLVLAETKRAPFDLPEAEAELVAGYNVEYASMGFALFFLAEYASMAAMSAITASFFMFHSGIIGQLPLSVLTMLYFFPFLWVRNSLPRYRPDQFMRLGWKCYLPITLVFLAWYHTLALSCDHN